MPGVFDQGTVDRVQQANNIIDVVSEYVSLTKRGSEMVGVCPFHDDHRPSMYVTEAKQIFKCFACGAGGDVFKFVQMREHLSFPQAIERLAQRAGISVQSAGPAKPRRKDGADDPGELARVNDWACRYFQANLDDAQRGKQARDYVLARQISPDSMKEWRMGLALDVRTDLLVSASQRRIPQTMLEATGVVTGNGQDKFVNRLMFPIADVTGRIVGFGGRTLGNDRAKYVNSPTTALFDKSQCLYGLEQARHEIVKTDTAVIVEGYTDVIMAHQLGCKNVVATLGTSLTSGHGRLLRRYAKTVVLIFDGDTAGMEAANRALDVCLKHHIDIKVASIPDGLDPCDFILHQGKAGFDQLIRTAIDVLKFKWDRLNDRFQGDETLTGRKAALEEFLQTIATSLWAGNLGAIDRGLIVNRLAKMIGLDTREVDTLLDQRMRVLSRGEQTASDSMPKAETQCPTGVSSVAQREVLEVLLNEPGLLQEFKDDINIALFDVPLLKQVAEALLGLLQTKQDAVGADLLARIESVDLAQFIAELIHVGQQKGNNRSRLRGALDVLLRAQDLDRVHVAQRNDPGEWLKSAAQHARAGNRHTLGLTE
jgi:DNA primase